MGKGKSQHPLPLTSSPTTWWPAGCNTPGLPLLLWGELPSHPASEICSVLHTWHRYRSMGNVVWKNYCSNEVLNNVFKPFWSIYLFLHYILQLQMKQSLNYFAKDPLFSIPILTRRKKRLSCSSHWTLQHLTISINELINRFNSFVRQWSPNCPRKVFLN